MRLRLRAVDPQTAVGGIEQVLAAAGGRATVVHCCDPRAPLPLLLRSGAGAVAVDTTRLTPAGWEPLAVAVEGGTGLYAGCLPTDASGTTQRGWQDLAQAWQRTGLPLSALGDLVVSPACGLAGLSPEQARSVQRSATEVAQELTERAGS